MSAVAERVSPRREGSGGSTWAEDSHAPPRGATRRRLLAKAPRPVAFTPANSDPPGSTFLPGTPLSQALGLELHSFQDPSAPPPSRWKVGQSSDPDARPATRLGRRGQGRAQERPRRRQAE